MADLKAVVGAELSQFERGMRQVEQRADQMGKSMKRLGDSMSKLVTGPLVALAAGFVNATRQAANYADEIDKTSIRTGVSRERLQELRFVTDQVGVSFGSVERTIDSFRRRLPQIEQGTGRASANMEKLGISTRDASGEMRNMEELFNDVLRELAAIENETERSALAVDLFGRSASQLAPLLAQGEDGIAQLTDRAHELGLVMGDETISELVEFKDMWAEITQELGAVSREFGMVLMPLIRDELIPFLQDRAIPAIRDIADRFNDMDDSTKRTVLAVGAFVAAGGPLLSLTGRLLTNVTPLIGAFRRLTAVMLANPYLAVGAAVLALSAHLYRAHRASQQLRREMEALQTGEQEIVGTSEERERIMERILELNRLLQGRRAQESQHPTIVAAKEEKSALEDLYRQSAQMEGQRIASQRAAENEADAIDGQTQSILGNIEAQKELRQLLLDEIERMKFTGDDIVLDDVFEDMVFGAQTLEEAITDLQERIGMGLGVSISEVNDILAELNQQFADTSSPERRAELEQQIEMFELMRDELHGVNNELGDTNEHFDSLGYAIGTAFDRAMFNAINQVDLFNKGWDDVGATVQRVMRQLINDLARMALMRGFQALLGISTGGAGFGLAALFGGFRADGGPVSAGRSYVVGERGPELFTPSASGYITSNESMASGSMGRPASGAMNIHLTGKFVAEGGELVYVIDEYNRKVLS